MNEDQIDFDGKGASVRQAGFLRRLRQAGVLLGSSAIVFSVALWIAEYAGIRTDIPFVLIGIAGLVVYNLSRLPVYLARFFPEKEEEGPKFHRRDG